MGTRQIYCPDNVWLLTFNGFGRNPDTEPISLVYHTRYAALEAFRDIMGMLKTRYPDHTWNEDADKQNNTKKIAFRLESAKDPRIMVETHRIRFLENPTFWWDGGINQDDEELALFAKGVNV